MRKSVVFAVLSIFVLLLSSCGAENNVDLISFIEEEKEMVEMNDLEKVPHTVDYNDPDWAKDCWVVDIDPDWPQIYVDPTSKETVLASIDDYFKYILDTGVTDIAVCPFEQNSLVPTESDGITWMYEKYNWTEENGVPVDYSKYEGLYKVYTEMGLDIFEIVYGKIKDAGVRPWLTFRMNDVHYGSESAAYIRSDLFYEAKENGYMLGNKYGYYATGFDFSHERIRQVMLDYIEELALRYDVFGLQLDFIREIFCFDYINNDDCTEIMTQFVRDVKAIVEKAEVKFGHPIKLSVRFGRSIEHNKVFGFDAESWVKEGLVDVLVPSPRWEVTDSAVPVEEWKNLAGDNVAIWAGMESRMTNKSKVTADYVKGYSAGFYAKGADGVYFDNFYQLGSDGPSIWGFERKDLTQGVRKYVVTYQDIVPEGMSGYKPLPLSLKNQKEELVVCMGEVNNTETVHLILAMEDAYLSSPTVKLNGVGSSSRELIETPDGIDFNNGAATPLIDEAQFLLYTFRGVDATEDIKISFENGIGKVVYVELFVEP